MQIDPPPARAAPPPGRAVPARPAEVELTYGPDDAHGPGAGGGPRWTFRFADPESAVTFRCRIDGGHWSRCTSPKIYRHLRPGRHIFEVRAVAGGAEESAVRTVSFLVGNRRH